MKRKILLILALVMLQADNGLRDHDPFLDQDTISPYALDAADWSAANGVILGDEKGFLRPRDGASRAQCVTMLMRLDGYLNQTQQEETP